MKNWMRWVAAGAAAWPMAAGAVGPLHPAAARPLAARPAAAAPGLPGAQQNLVLNGSFDDEKEPLNGWQTKYELAGDSWYSNNVEFVSVLPAEAGRKTVLLLNVKTKFLADFPGVKTDSKPIPVEKGARYRFSAVAKSGGPNCRILIEGYKWKPGIKPHADPDLAELRKCYKCVQLYFGAQKGGDFGGVGPAWSTGSMTLPDPKMTPLAKGMYDDIRFFVVHMVGIGGKMGPLYVDDVTIEKIN